MADHGISQPPQSYESIPYNEFLYVFPIGSVSLENSDWYKTQFTSYFWVNENVKMNLYSHTQNRNNKIHFEVMWREI